MGCNTRPCTNFSFAAEIHSPTKQQILDMYNRFNVGEEETSKNGPTTESHINLLVCTWCSQAGCNYFMNTLFISAFANIQLLAETDAVLLTPGYP